MCCCTNIYRLPSIKACGTAVITLPSVAPSSGIFTLKLSFLNSTISEQKTFAEGDPFVFEFEGLNENYTYQGWYEDAAGVRVKISVDDVDYDCIEFETKLMFG